MADDKQPLSSICKQVTDAMDNGVTGAAVRVPDARGQVAPPELADTQGAYSVPNGQDTAKTNSALQPSAVQTSQLAKDLGASHYITMAGKRRLEFVENLLNDAERMLTYSVQTGMEVKPEIHGVIIKAKIENEWEEKTVGEVLDTVAALARQLKPVTAESLRDCEKRNEKKAMQIYKWLAIFLAALIFPYSVATFVTSAISDAIKKNIATANDLAVKLIDKFDRTQTKEESGAPSVGTESSLTLKDLKDLQEFLATMRNIDGSAGYLQLLVFGISQDPFKDQRNKPEELKKIFEVPIPLPLSKLSEVANDKLAIYQSVRRFAVEVEEAASILYGALATCLLPVLYALLGACAFLLRSFEQQVKARTFTFNDAHAARLITAAIGGAVVGLFSKVTIVQTASIPPLALAFLVGYAVDVFFSSLESLFPTLNRGKDGRPV